MKHDAILNQPTLEGASLDLRPVRASDAGLIELYASDARVAAQSVSIPHPLPPGSTQAFIAAAWAEDRITDFWILDASKTGGAEVMGLIWLERLGRNQSSLGGWVVPAFWNLGVASASVELILASNPQNVNTYFASVFQDNPASARVLTKAGFQYLGDAEQFCVARDAHVPIWTYSRRAG